MSISASIERDTVQCAAGELAEPEAHSGVRGCKKEEDKAEEDGRKVVDLDDMLPCRWWLRGAEKSSLVLPGATAVVAMGVKSFRVGGVRARWAWPRSAATAAHVSGYHEEEEV